MNLEQPKSINPAQAFERSLTQTLLRLSARQGAPLQARQHVGHILPRLVQHLALGHTCMPLQALSDSPAELRAALIACGLTSLAGDPSPHPLVLDEQDRLYLYRYFDYEQRLKRACLARLALPPRLADPARARAALDAHFGPDAADAPDYQKLAAALALINNLTLISGGPGTGKTTTVVSLLACLLAENPHCRIALAAPTGKAAARMQEAISSRAADLPPEIRAILPGSASTLHRLLGMGGIGREVRYHARNPLPFDVVIVDEASMLDLAMATQLLEAVPAAARLILLGDKHQLAAVEPGAVFGALTRSAAFSPDCRERLATLTTPPPAAAGEASTGWLADCTVWLEKNYRFAESPGIGELARQVNQHAGAATLDWLATTPCDEVQFQDLQGQPLPESVWQTWIACFAPMLARAGSASLPAEILAAHAQFARFRILCAVRRGPRGVESINQTLARKMLRQAQAAGLPTQGDWFPGRPVMVLENDYRLGVFNGDIGLTLALPDGSLNVFFPGADQRVMPFDPVRLPRHETAFAMTVHKSQGSEFERIALVLPDAPSPVLTSEWVYTGVTRARRQVVLLGEAARLEEAIGNPTRRNSGL